MIGNNPADTDDDSPNDLMIASKQRMRVINGSQMVKIFLDGSFTERLLINGNLPIAKRFFQKSKLDEKSPIQFPV